MTQGNKEQQAIDEAVQPRKKPPARHKTLGATDATARKDKPKTQKTSFLGIRTTPETKQAIKLYAVLHQMKINEVIERAFLDLKDSGSTPQPIPETIKKPKDPRDQNAGRDEDLDIWGNQATRVALEKLSELEGCSPSELVKIMLIERLNTKDPDGKKTGLVISR